MNAVDAEAIERLYRLESRRILATLIRILGDFDRAEEAMQDAFTAALEQWPREGLPTNPRAWLISAARFKAIDSIRRRARFDSALIEIANQLDREARTADPFDDQAVKDDDLRLIFTCCHPALPPDAQVALTLREVCGLATEEIARAFLCTPPTIAQRIVRAKSKIRGANIPYRVPDPAELPERLEMVLHVVYLAFNEGYSASSGESVTRSDLSKEAIRLGRLLASLLPDPEVLGLLALMLLQESRRAARSTAEGDLILLDDQDRRRWDRELIAEGLSLAARTLSAGTVGPFAIQAAIAAEHARAGTPSETNWRQIVEWYDLLLQATPSPIVQLNRAVAISMRDGPEAGLHLIESILAEGELGRYYLAHSARGELCRRLGRKEEARASFATALELTNQEPERRFLMSRLKLT